MIVKPPPRMTGYKMITQYLQQYLFSWLKEVTNSLNGLLTFNDNFRSFLVKDVTIAAGATAEIPNRFSDTRRIPTERYIVRQTGNGVITDGEWTVDTLELVNQGASSVTISVRFFHFFEE